MNRWYESPELLIIPLVAVQTLQLSGDDWYEEIPEDDETELM